MEIRIYAFIFPSAKAYSVLPLFNMKYKAKLGGQVCHYEK
jgi:hypothetical protein